MPTFTAQNLVDRCKADLKDPSSVTWTEANLLSYLNAAQRAIAKADDSAYMITAATVLVAGTKQTIPSGGIKFVSASRNMGTDAATPGQTPLMVDMALMNAADRDWHTATASATVENVMRSPDPKIFYVSPPQPASGFGSLEIAYTKSPPDILIGATILLEDSYANAIRYYMMAEAHSIEDSKADSALVANYMALFSAEINGN